MDKANLIVAIISSILTAISAWAAVVTLRQKKERGTLGGYNGTTPPVENPSSFNPPAHDQRFLGGRLYHNRFDQPMPGSEAPPVPQAGYGRQQYGRPPIRYDKWGMAPGIAAVGLGPASIFAIVDASTTILESFFGMRGFAYVLLFGWLAFIAWLCIENLREGFRPAADGPYIYTTSSWVLTIGTWVISAGLTVVSYAIL